MGAALNSKTIAAQRVPETRSIADFTHQQVRDWLHSQGFVASIIQEFAGFQGRDMLMLTLTDVENILPDRAEARRLLHCMGLDSNC